jgi:uncharacterized LabA/DUF88 family protein
MQRAMLFVDGSNFLIELGSVLGTTIRAEKATPAMLHLATMVANNAAKNVLNYGSIGEHRIVRRYWFGSVQGSEEDLVSTQTTLRTLGYEAVLFHKRRGKDEKGVDLAVAREMLMHGFNKNYDTAALVAGDEDYLGLVHDVKRLGPLVVGAFFETTALSNRLRLAFDDFALAELPHAQAALIDHVKSEAEA